MTGKIEVWGGGNYLPHSTGVRANILRTSVAASDVSDVDSRTFQDIQKKPSLNETVSVHPSSNLVFGYLNLFSDGVHNFTDGMALGSAFLLHGPVGGWSRTLFLLAHELPQEVGDFGILVRSGFSVSKALFFNFLSALVALSGTALALVLGKDPGQSSLIEVLPRLRKEEEDPLAPVEEGEVEDEFRRGIGRRLGPVGGVGSGDAACGTGEGPAERDVGAVLRMERGSLAAGVSGQLVGD
ncbi:IAA-alanine resistance protein 1 [Platanthera guangdongensis]|uniref:IAA-alanine resistance protein 1 n=1 Tax=Platanthera guangdongensis TaxID=2320717 RepID=A0ABR2M260_9ASPA